ncbi:peptidoglycan-associated outer membrane lipoprotein, partial [Escherichia coli]|nr:peptidoglycan-associated outer membrane lipoprotein [Escherichia coli]
MQLNKVLKGLLIALPVMAVTACSSSDDAASNTGAATNNNGAVETTVA